jgi:segregation and condensation protein A
MMKSLNINIAGDFLVMASTLVHIKSKMLLPGLSDGEEEEDDFRVEITGPLLEYLHLKEIAGELSERELLNRDVFARRFSTHYKSQLQGEDPLLDINLFQLMDAFKKVIEETLPGVPISVPVEKWTVREKMTSIMDRLKSAQTIYFNDLFKGHKTISEFIVSFLALLELVHIGLVRVFQPDPGSDIRLEAHFINGED